ncbi:MAG: HAD family hydrolase [Bacteroidales bacterium]|nr:HAD family hydrolase [Bacteroidales bacterium]
MKEQVIVWDWNGTLLNDAEVCLTTMNNMLQLRNLQTIDIGTYKEIFNFPVKEYYKKIGFDFQKESFEELSVEFMDAYTMNLSAAYIVNGAKEVLGFLKSRKKENVIISAMKQDMLHRSIREKGIEYFFDDIKGIDDIYAASKTSIAIQYVRERGLSSGDILFIGDTIHDYEVASEIGSECILIADGHQSEDRLKATGATVIPALTALLPHLFSKSL